MPRRGRQGNVLLSSPTFNCRRDTLPLKDTRGSAGAHAPVGVLAGLSGGDEAPVAHRFVGDHDHDHDFKPRNNPRRAIRGPSYAPDSG